MTSLILILMASCSFSQTNLDQHSDKALGQTQDLLTSPDKRNEFIKNDSKAKQADQRVDDLTGSNKEAKEDIYALAAQIFQTMVMETKGDADKMNELISKARTNPEAFANKFSPEQRKMLRKIASDLESQMTPTK